MIFKKNSIKRDTEIKDYICTYEYRFIHIHTDRQKERQIKSYKVYKFSKVLNYQVFSDSNY